MFQVFVVRYVSIRCEYSIAMNLGKGDTWIIASELEAMQKKNLQVCVWGEAFILLLILISTRYIV